MKRNLIKFLCLLSMLLSVPNIVFADQQSPDTEHKDIAVGTISIGEFKQELIKFLKSHPEYKNQISILERDNVPSDIRLIKLAPNRHYDPSINAHKKFEPVVVNNLAPSYTLNVPGPLLNQGEYGTCVTFSLLGALANSKNSGRFLSDQSPIFAPSPSCFLQMLNSNGQNAWNGYWISRALPWIKNQGVISNELGQTGFCNNVYTTYQPYGYLSQKQAALTIATNTYTSRSDKLSTNELYERQFGNANDALNYIKQQISDREDTGFSYQRRGYYTVFAFYFSANPYDITSIDGTYPTWVDPGYVNTSAGHAIFAYGYDDNVTINGQKGVLYLRNSWGTAMNDSGNYRMTYTYFLKNFRTDEPVISMKVSCTMRGAPRLGCTN